jgi:hypothetical protein
MQERGERPSRIGGRVVLVHSGRFTLNLRDTRNRLKRSSRLRRLALIVGQTRPGARSVISCSSQRLPSGSLNDAYVA